MTSSMMTAISTEEIWSTSLFCLEWTELASYTSWAMILRMRGTPGPTSSSSSCRFLFTVRRPVMESSLKYAAWLLYLVSRM